MVTEPRWRSFIVTPRDQKILYPDEYDEMKRVFVTVEGPGKEDFKINLWRGKTVARIRQAAKRHYEKGCKLYFGTWW